ncbi:helix-turn-helix transcriptional regulator [Vibrio cholerae]|uniref:helix-turn-helix domain-containing protein n=1 Tax=Vibrio cholerae TaxID=666 RepID=UPI001581726B|nr:helix-turn-helix transcriptional regulator [Vibrio cholerae]EJI2332306.1 helix-turn-helix transcriptional regulator [Vibrio cholerae]EKF9397346.1 helix-turn-helix transcriptional regulator [Vibrio cholerae]EKF9659539.1 helix-turn-helix transcriptional regulator [Vibrio cholerae]EKF9678319.1 helix-turn-helix transcriptional regulator [Vibrio cholerae]EKF9959506.1 helix-turn-helix transcriptional regulator [Vibrio cholerae]
MVESALLDSFGLRVKELRKQQKISQERLAEICELDRTYISSIERGQRNVSLINIVKISAALNTTASFLLEGIEVKNEQY